MLYNLTPKIMILCFYFSMSRECNVKKNLACVHQEMWVKTIKDNVQIIQAFKLQNVQCTGAQLLWTNKKLYKVFNAFVLKCIPIYIYT